MTNILIVEDNDENFFLLEEILEDYKINITRASNGKEFYSIIAGTHDFNLVLMDLMLPDTDGIELTKYLIGNKIKIPIVFISAYTERCEEIFELGVDYFLNKPVMIELFLSIISKYVKLVEK
jgi:CheY-like chemotaxis protein